MQEVIDKLTERFGEAIVEPKSFRGDESCIVSRNSILEVCRYLRDEHYFDMLTDLCGADYPDRKTRFEVIYHLYSVKQKKRIRLKVRLSENESIQSACDIWKAVNWFEREAYDLFGIKFDGHPNLKRILCHHEFEGHALRKDYPKNRRGKIPTPDKLVT